MRKTGNENLLRNTDVVPKLVLLPEISDETFVPNITSNVKTLVNILFEKTEPNEDILKKEEGKIDVIMEQVDPENNNLIVTANIDRLVSNNPEDKVAHEENIFNLTLRLF